MSALPPGLYPRLLGRAWWDLDPAIRRAHPAGAIVRAEGILCVRHGTGLLRRLLLVAAGVPPPAERVSVQLVVSRRGRVERWQRTFGARRLATCQSEAGGLLVERAGPLEIRFRLTVRDGSLLYRQVGLALCLGPLRLPLPRWLALHIAGREGPTGDPDRTSLTVEVAGPRGGLLFSYHGSVRWEGTSG